MKSHCCVKHDGFASPSEGIGLRSASSLPRLTPVTRGAWHPAVTNKRPAGDIAGILAHTADFIGATTC
jgi:hypothetical protein